MSDETICPDCAPLSAHGTWRRCASCEAEYEAQFFAHEAEQMKRERIRNSRIDMRLEAHTEG